MQCISTHTVSCFSEKAKYVSTVLSTSLVVFLLFAFAFFQSSDRGMLTRISSFFKKKKSSSSRHSSETDAGSPASPTTPTPSQKDCGLAAGQHAGNGTEKTGHGRASSPGGSNETSVQASDTDLPFADSDSSGRSSVREMHVCKRSPAGSENNSGAATPTAMDFTSDLQPVSSPEPGFTESLVLEVSKRLQASMAEQSQNARGTQNAPGSSNFTTYKTSMRVGENRHSTAVTEIRLGSRSRPIRTEREEEVRSKESSAVEGRTRAFSPETSDAGGDRLAEKEHLPRDDSPIRLHKAIWVETHLGEEEEEQEEVEKGSRGEGTEASSPPVQAVIVAVVPDDDSLARGPSTPAETSAAARTSSAASPGGSRTPPSPEGPDAGRLSKQGSLSKQRSGEVRVTRKTVNLPSKHKVFARKVYVDASSDEEEQCEDLTSKASGASEEEKP